MIDGREEHPPHAVQAESVYAEPLAYAATGRLIAWVCSSVYRSMAKTFLTQSAECHIKFESAELLISFRVRS